MENFDLKNDKNRCRVCLSLKISVKTQLDLKSLIVDCDPNTKISYAEAFQQITGFTILEHEPQTICRCCGDLIMASYKLVHVAQKTQYLLENQIKHNLVTENLEVKTPEKKIKNSNHEEKFFEKPSESFNCKLCKRNFQTQNRLDTHSKSCNGILNVCPICGEMSTRDHIRYHIKSSKKDKETSEKLFICDICGITRTSRSNIDIHMRVRHLKILSKCRICPATFKNPSALTRHMKITHSDISKEYKCRKCNFKTMIEKDARNHRESHSLKKLVCHECGQSFNKRVSLRYHLASHSDARPFVCEICGAAFKTTKAVGAHKKTHKAYDYECPVCTRAYLTNQLMRSHVEKNHPEFELPPPGTVFSKSYKKKMAERQLKNMAIKKGIDLNDITVPDTVINQVQSIHVVRYK